MKAIRIGNDIVVRWYILRNGQPADLSSTARHISVILSCRGDERRITDYVIDGNCIVFTFYGCDQKKPGTYRLTFVENEGLENMHTVDSCDAFVLVDTSQKVGGQCGCDNLQVESVNLTSMLWAPSDGLSAYEVALKNGFEGTEEEWLQSLLPDMTDIEMAEVQRQANELERIEAENTRQSAELERQETSAEAVASANAAASNANEAASIAQQKAEEANKASVLANTAASNANTVVGEFNSIIVQETGDAQDKVISQYGVTKAIRGVINKGYLFAGIATPETDPGTPEAKVCYIANGKGTYTNFDGIEVTEDDAVILYYDTAWHKEATGLAINEKLDELEQEATTEHKGLMSAKDKTTIRSLAEIVKEEEKADTLYIVDAKGNVVAHFGNKGLTVIDVALKGQDGALISVLEKISTSKSLTNDEYSKLQGLLLSISSMYEDALYITDAKGNVILQITNNGISFISSSKKTWMEGLVMMSLCDSLGTAGVWQETIAKNTGMIFDKKLNYNGNNDVAFSVGGSQTATHPNGGFDRAIRLVNYVNSGGKCDVLFLENINDSTWVNVDKTKEDIDAMITTEQPFFCEQYRYIDTPSTDYHSAGVYFRENLSSCLDGLSPKKGTTIYIGYGRSGKKLTVTSGASINGSFSITVGGKTYNISVNGGDAISAIIEKILEIDYADQNYTDTKVEGENAVLFMPTDAEETASLTFNANGTGVTATITSVDSKSYRADSYNSLDTTSSAWLTASNWGELWSHNLVQIMKGLIEYLSSNLPSTQLYWFIPTRFDGIVPTTKREDGSIDFDAYKANDKRYDMCTYIQRKVCEYYSIPVIDLHNEGGINIYNQLSYYILNGGVHPPHSTYEYWGNKATKFIV